MSASTGVPDIAGPEIVVELDGDEASWSPDGGFAGADRLVDSAREAAGGRYDVEWGRLPAPQVADAATPVGALAALMYANPGRTRILVWPDELRQWWEDTHEDCGLDGTLDDGEV